MLYSKVRNSRALKKKAVSPPPSAPPPLPPVPIESPAQAERSELRKQVDARVFSFDTISEEDVPEIPALPVDPSRPSLVQKPRKQQQVAVEKLVVQAYCEHSYQKLWQALTLSTPSACPSPMNCISRMG